jgi:hypothetical protein
MRPHRIDLQPLFFRSAFWLGLAGLLSCSAADEAPGGHLEHPTGPQPAPTAMPSLSAEVAPATTAPMYFMTSSGVVIADPHLHFQTPWSKNVPVRACTKDDECGDGFCDRDRCAAFYTWTRYGLWCGRGDPCIGQGHLCIDGRCRSCMSDAECVTASGRSDLACDRYGRPIERAGSCYIRAPLPTSEPQTPAPPPVPSTSSQP